MNSSVSALQSAKVACVSEKKKKLNTFNMIIAIKEQQTSSRAYFYNNECIESMNPETRAAMMWRVMWRLCAADSLKYVWPLSRWFLNENRSCWVQMHECRSIVMEKPVYHNDNDYRDLCILSLSHGCCHSNTSMSYQVRPLWFFTATYLGCSL